MRDWPGICVFVCGVASLHFCPFVLNSVLWTFLGFLLTGIALWRASGNSAISGRGAMGSTMKAALTWPFSPPPKEMRLIIQIRVILEILISCFLGSNAVKVPAVGKRAGQGS